MDSIRVSEAPDPGSIPGEATHSDKILITKWLLSILDSGSNTGTLFPLLQIHVILWV
jgi:hypothetical protein